MGLENEIRELINEVTSSKYIGKLKVSKEDIGEDNPLWVVAIYLSLDTAPLILAYPGTYDAFKEFVRKEIKERKLEMIAYWNTKRESIEEIEDYYE